jgi:hypothetical protein
MLEAARRNVVLDRPAKYLGIVAAAIGAFTT